jgi:thioredoxin reductase
MRIVFRLILFAVGDARNGLMSRVAAAVGEGSIAAASIHLHHSGVVWV